MGWALDLVGQMLITGNIESRGTHLKGQCQCLADYQIEPKMEKLGDAQEQVACVHGVIPLATVKFIAIPGQSPKTLQDLARSGSHRPETPRQLHAQLPCAYCSSRTDNFAAHAGLF